MQYKVQYQTSFHQAERHMTDLNQPICYSMTETTYRISMLWIIVVSKNYIWSDLYRTEHCIEIKSSLSVSCE